MIIKLEGVKSSDLELNKNSYNNDVIKQKKFPSYWPFVQGIYRSLVNSMHNGPLVTGSFDIFFEQKAPEQMVK